MITSQPQPFLIADTFAEIIPANFPNNSLFYAMDIDKFFRINSGSLIPFAGLGFIDSIVPNGSYRTLLSATGSHTAGRVSGTYGMAEGNPIAITGTGILYPLNVIYIAAADYPTLNSVPAKLRIRAQLVTNSTPPTGNYTFGLYPITVSAGGVGLATYSLGTVVSGSDGASFIAPAAISKLNAVGSDFALPADGHYVIGIVTSTTVAASAHVHLSALLQLRNH